jgi:AraC-like DNA-binding protein
LVIRKNLAEAERLQPSTGRDDSIEVKSAALEQKPSIEGDLQSLVFRNADDGAAKSLSQRSGWSCHGQTSAQQSLPNGDNNHFQSPVARLLVDAHEDLNRLHNILRCAGYEIFLCNASGVVIDGCGLPRHPCDGRDWESDPHAISSERPEKSVFKHCGPSRPTRVEAARRSAAAVEFKLPYRVGHSRQSWATAPIFGTDGKLIAALGVWSRDQNRREQPNDVIRAVVSTTARAIEERLFRERYRREWIIAVKPEDIARSAVLFAVNRNHCIVGADRYGQSMLADLNFTSADRTPEKGITLWALFEADSTLFRHTERGDINVALVPVGTTKVWFALITPPEGPPAPWRNPNASLHARPRIDSIGYVRQFTSESHARGGLSPLTLQRVCQYMDAHLETNIHTETLARIAGLSRWHFVRAFGQSAGATPHSYLVHRRLGRAQQLLADTDLPLAEIALKTGFSDQSHFGRRFMQFYGVSPSIFRRSRR